MKTIRNTLSLAVAVSIGAPAFAQTSYFTPGSERVIATNSTTTTGAGRTFATSGDFTGDHRRDIVMIDLVDDHMDFYYDPGLMSAAFPILDGAKDLSWVRGTSTGHQRFVTTSASGLTLYDVYDEGSYTTTALGTSAWNGARRVISGMLDGNSSTDLVGLSSDGLSLIVTRGATTESPTTATYSLGAVPLDIAVGNWSGSSDKEIFLLYPAGVNVRTLTGSNVGTVYFTVASGSMAVFSQDGYSYDRVAVVYTASGSEYLRAIDSSTTESPVSLPAGSYAVDAADVDGDDDDDLLIACRDVDDCTLLYNESDGVAPGTSATFTASSGETIDLYDGSTGSNTDQNARPLFEDFDNDGDPDVAMYVSDLDSLVVQYNSAIVAMENAPMLNEDPGDINFDIHASPTTMTLTANMDPVDSGSDKITVQIWTVDQVTGLTDPEVFYTESRDIDETTETFVFEFIDHTETLPELAAVDRNYILIFQEETVNGNGVTVSASSPFVLFLSFIEDEFQDVATLVNGTNYFDYCITDLGGNTECQIAVEVPMAYGDPGEIEVPIREIGPGGVCVPDVPPVPLPPKPID